MHQFIGDKRVDEPGFLKSSLHVFLVGWGGTLLSLRLGQPVTV